MLDSAQYLLHGVENGTLDHEKAAKAAEGLDPVLVHFIIRYLREKYPPTDPASSGVIERIVTLTSTHPNIVARAKKGEKDPIVEWFNDSYSLRSFLKNDEEFLQLLIDKIEG